MVYSTTHDDHLVVYEDQIMSSSRTDVYSIRDRNYSWQTGTQELARKKRIGVVREEI